MRTSVKATIVTAAVIVVLLIIVLVFALTRPSAQAAPDPTAGPPPVQRPNSQVLDEGGKGAVTLVEFLDFECEACGAWYPVVEELRKTYAGKITYVVRYFPLPGHLNSTNAAVAAEAAAQQGRFEDMYRRLFATQPDWAEAKTSRADVFRGYATELGLDMAAYDKAVADPATITRVEQDLNDGQNLGVNSTPTFFLDGKRLELQKQNDLENAVASATKNKN
ncbi:thioredoxin domain-containing protein [Microbacterium sp. USTB-Y]|uniref:DsbA family protein n=1 Tax=Microbacterium sp. USTB-Y TaxID=2823692 RepID=UPI0020425DE0|nr:thioredoxin domain-containing protein [Microbacterium sp. USTB-Y]MBS1900717.1 thioredoxin domain-containing protein [Actinomycetota bacterium]